MTEIWVCPNCDHEFDPERQIPFWTNCSVVINCPKCGDWMDTKYRKQWRKKNGKT